MESDAALTAGWCMLAATANPLEGPMLSDDAQTVYRAMMADPSLGVAGLCSRLNVTEDVVRGALDDLADASLLDLTRQDAAAAAHPWLTLSDVIAKEEAALLARQERLQSMRTLLQSVRLDYESALQHERIVTHTSVTSIQARLEQLALGATVECVSFNPGRAHTPTDMEASKPLNQRALERGVGIRCIYQDSFRHDPGTLGYARWLTELGGEVRTMPLVPQNLVIVDRQVALLPRTPGKPEDGAAEISTPSVVEALADYFDAVWATSDPFGTRAPASPDVEVPALTRQVLTLLASGVTDESAAKRLGLSARTVRRLMAKAMDDLGAVSRFQAGVAAVGHGWVDAASAR